MDRLDYLASEVERLSRLVEAQTLALQAAPQPSPNPTRRRMLRRLATGLLTGAGLAVTGFALNPNAQAKLVANPANFPTVGSIILTKGGIIQGSNSPFNPNSRQGLYVSAKPSLDTAVLPPNVMSKDTGIYTEAGNGGYGIWSEVGGDNAIGMQIRATGRSARGLNAQADFTSNTGGTSQTYGIYVTASSNVTGTMGPDGQCYGIFAQSSNTVQNAVSYAGYFANDVKVNGNLSKAGGSFTIDHPLEPATKYLSHSFVESPDMLNIYNGTATLDGNGATLVTLPVWFEALNRDFQYQLTALHGAMPGLFIAETVQGNQFSIGGGTPDGAVSWMLTGIRQDAYANAHRIKVEEDKLAQHQGKYLHPELFGADSSKAVHQPPKN